jgi:hypothetical protein
MMHTGAAASWTAVHDAYSRDCGCSLVGITESVRVTQAELGLSESAGEPRTPRSESRGRAALRV